MVRTVHNFFRNRLLLLVLVIAVIGFFAYNRHSATKTNIIPSKNTTVKATPNSSPQTAASLPSSESPKNTTTGPGATASPTGELKAPYGTFVSNHKPQPNDQEGSTCITTPGATCYIQFTNGDTVKKLAAQTVSGSGSTSWVWSLSDAGLSQGSWRVAAVATLNGQTKTTTDQVALEVQ